MQGNGFQGGLTTPDVRFVNARAVIAAAAAALAILFEPHSARAEPRIALVAGNAAYATHPLRNPRHDAETMSAALKSVGFEVIEAFDLDAEHFRAAIAEFSRRIKGPGAVALFYYAGHGAQFAGENYLIPVDAGISGGNGIAGLVRQAIPLGDVMKTLAGAHTALNIVILDACRDAPSGTPGFAAGEDGLAPEVAPANTMIGYATAPGEIAHDGAGANSPYTAALAYNIPRPGTTLEEVFRDTRRAVVAATAGTQVPWEHSSLMGAFYFKESVALPESSAARLAPDPAADARLAEVEAWERIKGSSDASLFKAHIARYPSGLFAELAALKITKLGKSVAERPWTWEVTSSIASTQTQTAAAAFERAVMLQSLAATDNEWRVVAALFSEAAEAGLPQAMYEKARAYDKGRGVPRDLGEAARWYGEAAERDHAGAMVALGTMYEFGDGAPQNLAEALRLYGIAAAKGDAAGMTSLAYLLASGKGAARNPSEARRLYEKAAAKGLPRALYNLALLELTGEGGRKDPASGIAHLNAAAQKGHAAANEELAHLYDDGKLVPRDHRRAAALLVESLQASGRSATEEIFRRRWSFATKRELQKTLAERGLYSGLRHGFMDAETRRALLRLAGG